MSILPKVVCDMKTLIDYIKEARGTNTCNKIICSILQLPSWRYIVVKNELLATVGRKYSVYTFRAVGGAEIEGKAWSNDLGDAMFKSVMDAMGDECDDRRF